MKSKFVSKGAAYVAVSICLLFAFTSCKKNNKVDNQRTITDIVSASPDFSILKSAVVKADLATTLSGPGPFTVFAPNNDAFVASGIPASAIAGIPAEQLKSILLYHTLGAKVVSADVPAGPNAAVTTAGGGTVYVTKNNTGVYVNGWKVTTADIPASNGVVHAIEHVLMPPAGNLVEVAQANPNLTYLVAAVLRASEGSTNVAQVLSGTNPLTVFAPTNQAFIDAGFPTIASIQQADPATLTTILTYHVVAARAFSSDLSDGQNLTTVNGGKIKIALGGGTTVKGNGNSAPSKITAVNIMATNGVVHVIDRVLLP